MTVMRALIAGLTVVAVSGCLGSQPGVQSNHTTRGERCHRIARTFFAYPWAVATGLTR